MYQYIIMELLKLIEFYCGKLSINLFSCIHDILPCPPHISSKYIKKKKISQ